jgi:hypothetical protein
MAPAPNATVLDRVVIGTTQREASSEALPLPSPVSTTDFWLAAVVRELRGIRADLARATSQRDPDLVELREPAKPAKRRS